MDYLLQLPGTAQDIVLLLAVIAIKFVIAKLSTPAQGNFFHFYCLQLANKVNKAHHSKRHKQIAGAIATLITLIPIVVILWLFEQFIALPWLWSALLLYFSLGPMQLNAIAKQEAKYLADQDKYQAKQLLAPFVLRDTEQLSPLGLIKASIEMLVLKSSQQYIVISCCFLLFGPLVAFSYRMLLEMHYSWNIKRLEFNPFGQFVHQLVALAQWLPNRVMLLALMLTSMSAATLLHWRLIKCHLFRLNNDILLGYFAYCLGIQLGGVAMYDRVKLRRVSFNQQARQPEVKHILLAIKQLNLVTTLLLGLLLSILILVTIIKVNH